MNERRDWQEVEALFQEALERPADERQRFILERASTPEILREVASLLAAHPAAAGFLSESVRRDDVAGGAQRLAPHTRLGHFEILELIGAGGMGEVYRARDTRLDRAVAIKVLSRELLAHQQGRERLEREARLVSRLTHAHICVLHDVGIAPVDGFETPFLVMELVEGETLAARLGRGPLPIDQALTTAVEILEALTAAHEAGIVHRDLKPGNIMLTRAGVKLLDFGLARLERRLEGPDSHGASASEPLTREGHLLGTLPYMAPEQLRGGEADARSDLFAFGAVLYEMVTGRRAFDAESDPALIAAILEREPVAMASHQPLTPSALDRIASTCLAKDPGDRWPRARDVLRELIWLRDDRRHVVTPPLPRGRTTRHSRVTQVAAAIALLALAAWALFSRPPMPTQRVTFTVLPPKGTTFQRGTAHMAISPDGSRLAFVALSSDGTERLWLRRFDAAEPQLIAGTEGAVFPFWSPDSRTIGFVARNKLVRIDEHGGARQELADVRIPGGAAWSPDGATIVFSTNRTLHMVAASGGTPTPVSALDKGREERQHAFPLFLPDGRRFLYLALSTIPRQSGIFQGTLDAADVRLVVAGATSFAVAGPYLLTLTDRTLNARPFDAERAEVTGEPLALASGVGLDVRYAYAGFSAAANAALAYRIVGDQSRLTWYDRTGREVGSFPDTGDYQHPWLSPDERYLVVEKTDPTSGRHTLWKLDLARNVLSRLLDDPSGAHGPVWSRDGSQIAFGSNRLGGVDLFVMNASGGGTQNLLVSSERETYRLSDWSPDGRFILYWSNNGDLWTVPVAPRGPPQRFLESKAHELQGAFSPDMRWIAYTSDESGTAEVYVRRFPNTEGAWRVSTSGGAQAMWRRDGGELFYLAPDGNLMATNVKATDASFETDAPRALFDTGVRGLFLDRRYHYAVTRDGQRFLVDVTAEDDNVAPITVVMNWRSGGN